LSVSSLQTIVLVTQTLLIMQQQHHLGEDRSENNIGPRKKPKTGASSTLANMSDDEGDISSLCTRCSSINAVTLFNSIEKMISSSQIMSLGTFDSPESRSCQGCKLFYSVSNVEAQASSPKPQFLYAHQATSSEIWGRKGRVLMVASEDSEDDLDYHLETRGANSCTSLGRSSKFVKARRILHDSINFEHLRHCISLCIQYHEKCRRYATEATVPRGMKLINCETRQVIPAQSHKYVALSYVWGLAALGPEYDDRVRNDRIPDNLPKTIEDAILATIRLGYSYIWIDRYCIDQDNAEEKESQITQMNFIYRKAEVTLNASAGSDPRFGLPGVSTTLRTCQPRAKIGGVELASIFPRPEVAVQQSKWAERGWTYQEGYFSIRRLAFNDDQVLFECYNGAAVETISHLAEEGLPYAAEDIDEGDQDVYEVLEHLSHYSGRQLTHDSDALNAVVGVFNDYGFKYGVTPHYLGVPLVRYSLFDLYKPEGQRRRVTEAFLVGLSWMNHESGRRRNIWPSWTWAEWAVSFEYGQIASGKSEDCFTLGTDFVVKPRAYIEMQNGTPLDLEDRSFLNTITRLASDLSHFIRIESLTLALGIHLRELGKIASIGDHRDLISTKENIAEYYAYLEHKDVDFETRFWPTHHDYSNSQFSNGNQLQSAIGTAANAAEEGEILGVVLSKLNLVNNQYCLILMVVQNKGAYYERIGHCCIMSHDLQDLAKRCGSVEEEWVFGWKKYHKTTAALCAKYMRRRMLRIR
jgi:hypothetical protein